MNEPMGTPPAPEPMLGAPKKSNTGLIIGIVVAVVLCCCIIVGAYVFYQYLGDPLLQALGLQ